MTNTSPTHIPAIEPSLFDDLATSATRLNLTLDRLGSTVHAIEQSLRELKLGVTAYAPTDGGWQHSDGDFERHVLTFSKGDGGWALRIVIDSGNVFDELSLSRETYRFGNAPKESRAAAVRVLPRLLKNLSDRAQVIATEMHGNIPLLESIAQAFSHGPPCREDGEK